MLGPVWLPWHAAVPAQLSKRSFSAARVPVLVPFSFAAPMLFVLVLFKIATKEKNTILRLCTHQIMRGKERRGGTYCLIFFFLISFSCGLATSFSAS